MAVKRGRTGRARMSAVVGLAGVVLAIGLSGCGGTAGETPATPTTPPPPSVSSDDYKAEFAPLPGGGRVLCIRNRENGSISCDWADYAGQNRRG